MAEKAKILIVDDDRELADSCKSLFEKNGYIAESIYLGKQALEKVLSDPTVKVVLTDLKMPDLDGIALLSKVKDHDPSISVVIMTGYGTIKNAVKALRIGAADYLTKPFDKQELLEVIQRAVASAKTTDSTKNDLQTRALDDPFGLIIGRSDSIKKSVEQAKSVANNLSHVFILGETGTGKELIARGIHYGGIRRNGPFTPVNCGALPRDLVEGELFGYKKGAFSGATDNNQGLFRASHGGTIFLDEIAEMPLEAQVKLLRVVQDKKVRPIGTQRELPVDVRIIAATNKDVGEAMDQGLLRRDLYYRLGVVTIRVPPLRERLGDVDILFNYFIDKHGRKPGIDFPRFTDSAMAAMNKYEWPGNVRELENLVEGLLWTPPEERIDRDRILSRLGAHDALSRSDGPAGQKVPSIEEMEKELILKALDLTKGDKTKAAEMLGISRMSIYRKLKQLK